MNRIRLAYLFLGLVAGAPVSLAAQIAILSDGIEEREALSGETYRGSIRIQNTTGEPQEVNVYLRDYQFFADGRSDYGEPGGAARSNARWITMVPTRLALAPHGQATVDYVVEVPVDGSDLAGSYWSMIMVEGLVTGSSESSSAGNPTVALQTRVRHGIQVVTHLSGGSVAARFDGVRVVELADGERALEFDLVNAGQQAWRVNLMLEVYDERGELVARLAGSRGLLYSGSSIRHQFRLDQLAEGSYRTLLMADTGAHEIFGTQYRLTL